MNTGQQLPEDRTVTLVIVYAERETVRIPMVRGLAVQAVKEPPTSRSNLGRQHDKGAVT